MVSVGGILMLSVGSTGSDGSTGVSITQLDQCAAETHAAVLYVESVRSSDDVTVAPTMQRPNEILRKLKLYPGTREDFEVVTDFEQKRRGPPDAARAQTVQTRTTPTRPLI
ncbi:hypothetical protein F2P81_014319 [Scophthalmus maximus]|uniref:Uncharacterized protein n=1 Tax=Scophthalmus maximus TaxID=52904 RepID=A0A6A4SJF6_SCOMX|nr:hypothetical protein F2P81_014319 [Scophthalmus maximus]